MTLSDACHHAIPGGPHAGKTLAALALDDPAYLIGLAESGGSEDCPAGTETHLAVRIVATQVLANYEDDIAAGRVLAPDEFTRADWCNDGVFGTAGSEAVAASNRKRGRHFSEPATAQQELFGGTR